jgi:murein DD-endopeptidase MepM/ murein hydrolase activator NlpD
MIELYKADKPDVVTVVLESDGFADLLERTEFMQRVTEQDSRIITIVRRSKADATRTAARLDRLEARGQRVAAIILERRDEVAAIKGQLVQRRDSYAAVRSTRRERLGSVRASRTQMESHLASLEKQQAAIQARLARAAGAPSAGPVKRGSGRLVYPASGPVSSPFGMRWGRLHAGIDMPLSEGTPLRAADSGRVVIAGFTGGYGNYTCIQHTGSLSTCYGHQSRLGTSVGANVSQGQVIGYSGNTGHSTGPHLHFEVRINGNPVDPMGYL